MGGKPRVAKEPEDEKYEEVEEELEKEEKVEVEEEGEGRLVETRRCRRRRESPFGWVGLVCTSTTSTDMAPS